MKSKICFKCNKDKHLTEYYKHKKMGDGHLNKCKSCTKSDSNKRRESLLSNDEWVESERSRHRDKYHRLSYKDKHKPTPERKKEIMSRYKEKYPEKYRAKMASQRIECPEGKERHHWSYNDEHWTDVIFLSIEDHNKIHRHMDYCEHTFLYKANCDLGEFKKGDLLYTRDKHESFIEQVLFPSDN